MNYKIDLHSHSYGSPDGGLLLRDYRYFLREGLLDYIAITDHNQIATALQIKAELGGLNGLGERIIIGEEVMTTAGEIIGLYLTELIPAGLTPQQAIEHIRRQGGLVYIPHPFETVRSGLPAEELDKIAAKSDIVEICNGRAIFQNRGPQAKAWTIKHGKPGAASSDAHGRVGWGQTYSIINQPPTRDNLAAQLMLASYTTRTVGLGALYPKLNRLLSKRSKVSRGTV